MLCGFLEAARLDAVGIFGYSDEDGTEAAGLPGQLSDDEILARVDRVSRFAEELTAQRAEDRVGELVEVLVESRRGTLGTGRTHAQGPEVDGTTTVRGLPPRGARRRPGRGTCRRRPRVSTWSPSPWLRRLSAMPVEGSATPGVADPAPSIWNLPNALTVLRILLVPVLGWLLLYDDGDDNTDAGLGVPGVLRGDHDRPVRRRHRPPPQPGDRLRQAHGPDRRQGADRDGVHRAVADRRALVVGHHRRAVPRGARSPCCASG